ncbi:hypothetical protein B484DRAFT_469878 [Ochromonadaceae sp. CCMP2298]|nr:hypothetical protein B484DRAFT_469878 [Ochromonadaceae sp. CCMP2298]
MSEDDRPRPARVQRELDSDAESLVQVLSSLQQLASAQQHATGKMDTIEHALSELIDRANKQEREELDQRDRKAARGSEPFTYEPTIARPPTTTSAAKQTSDSTTPDMPTTHEAAPVRDGTTAGIYGSAFGKPFSPAQSAFAGQNPLGPSDRDRESVFQRHQRRSSENAITLTMMATQPTFSHIKLQTLDLRNVYEFLVEVYRYQNAHRTTIPMPTLKASKIIDALIMEEPTLTEELFYTLTADEILTLPQCKHSLLLLHRSAAELDMRSLGEPGGLGQDGLQLCDEGQEICREVDEQLLLRPDLDVVVHQHAVDSGGDQACTGHSGELRLPPRLVRTISSTSSTTGTFVRQLLGAGMVKWSNASSLRRCKDSPASPPSRRASSASRYWSATSVRSVSSISSAV